MLGKPGDNIGDVDHSNHRFPPLGERSGRYCITP